MDTLNTIICPWNLDYKLLIKKEYNWAKIVTIEFSTALLCRMADHFECYNMDNELQGPAANMVFNDPAGFQER